MGLFVPDAGCGKGVDDREVNCSGEKCFAARHAGQHFSLNQMLPIICPWNFPDSVAQYTDQGKR
jgi:hypothetical protein